MSVTEPTKEGTEPQLQTTGEQEDTQINEPKDEQGQEGNEDDEKIQPVGGGTDVDHDAQEMVISSLRTQIQDLFSQVNQLNNKLVRSYDRVSDLEDSLHVTNSNLQLSDRKVNQLELEKSQHLSQLTSGSLVEKSHVTAELTRLMERATEEAAQRGQAESAREKIERELEELSASLFGEANGMVEEARRARSLSERKVEDAEGRLREAEEAVRMMQNQMQSLMQEKEDVERKPGALTPNSTSHAVEGGENLMKGHLGYHEYLAFLAHLRHLHVSNPNGVPPAMATLLQLPFLSRLLNEDSEPTLRLDLAPSLNWLSRRSVLSAIHTGQLSVEPISAGTLFTLSMESPLITIAGMSLSNLNVMTTKLENLEINVPCALCGSSIFPIDTNIATSITSNSYSTPTQPSSAPHFTSVHITMPSHTTWSAAAGSFFRKPSIPLTRALSSTSTINDVSINGNSTALLSTTAIASTTQSVLPNAKSKHATAHITPQTQIHIFRLASLPSSASAALSSLSLPLSKSLSQPVSTSMSNSSTPGSASSSRPASSASLTSSTTVASSQPTTFYPLCSSGWCLARLRATCTLWSFIRTGIVEKVWDEEVILPTPSPSVPPSPTRTTSSATSTHAPVELSKSSTEPSRQGKAPPLPPRRRGIWGIASALGERAASWGEGASREKRESKGFLFPSSDEKLTPGGNHIALIKEENITSASEGNNSHAEPTLNSSSTETKSTSSSLPPPLPKRSVNRSLSRRGENNSPAPTTPVERPTQPTLAGTDSTDPIHTPQVRTSPPTMNAHVRNSSLSQAANIPLPESRAGTPSLPADVRININGINAHTTPTPSRTASPALPAAGPPPVPRRAAARNRGGVGIVSSSSDGIKVDEKLKEDRLGHTTSDGETASAEVGAMVAKEGAVAEREGKETQSETAKPTSDVAAETSAEQDKLDVVQATDKKTDDLNFESESGERNGQHSGMNGVTETGEEEKERESEEPPAADTEEHPTEPSLATSDTDPSDKVDQTQYVGTSTWEEKMWLELVRIRKDMFYARVGAANF